MKTLYLLIPVIALDQISKAIIRSSMFVGQSISVLGDFFKISFVENRGIAFGIPASNHLLFTIFSAIASLAILFYFYRMRHESLWMRNGLVLILGGAIGNLIDRIVFKKVVDFLDFGFGNIRWWVFNVADAAVVIGMFLLIYITIQEERKQKTVSVSD